MTTEANARLRQSELYLAPEQMAADDVMNAVRRTLLGIYTPQQTARWLNIHADADPVEVARKALRLRGITRPIRAAAEPDVPTATLRRILATACRIIGSADHAGVWLLDGQQIGSPVGTGPASEVLEQACRDAGEGPAVEALDMGVVTVTDLHAETRWPAFTGHVRRCTEVRSILAIRVCEDDEPLGTLNLYSDEPDAFDAEDHGIAAVVAVRLGVALRAGKTDGEPREPTRDHEVVDQAKGILMTRPKSNGHAVEEQLRAGARIVKEALHRATEPELVSNALDRDAGDHARVIARNRAATRGDGSATRGDALTDLRAQEIVTAAVRGLLACDEAEEARALLLEAVHRLGGSVCRASEAGADALPIDLSLGAGEPLLASPGPDAGPDDRQLQAHLPQLVEDARRAVARLERSGRLAAEAELDPLTGLMNRRGYDRLTGRLGAGDVLILLDLDGFKPINDTYGHLVGDQVLRIFGAVLRDQVRIREHAVRFGGDEFLVVLQNASQDGSDRLLERLRIAWAQRRPLPVDFSAGAAVVTNRVDAALEAADRSLYALKASKRSRRTAASDEWGDRV